MKRLAGVFRRILGCRHSQMSRPYTVNDLPYRTCLACGARRRLNGHSWTRQHSYYFQETSGDGNENHFVGKHQKLPPRLCGRVMRSIDTIRCTLRKILSFQN